MDLIQDIVEEHLDEAAWLWAQRKHALLAPDHDMADTAEWEERLLAHVDGLVEGGAPVAETLLYPTLKDTDPARVSAAALALLNTPAPTKELVRVLLSGAGLERAPAVQRALELCEHEGLGELLLPLLRLQDAGLRAAALEVLVFREEAPDALLAEFLLHEDVRIRIAALRGLRVIPRTGKLNLLSQSLASPHPALQQAAIEVGLTLGLREPWEACRQAMRASKTPGREMLVLWAMGGGEEDMNLLVELLRTPQHRADALWALGFSGRVVAAEACLPWLEDEKVARLAGEAFSAITGLRLEGGYVLPPEALPEEPIPLEQEDLDADLSPRPEDNLPLPHPETVTAWWRAERNRFTPGTRYLMGHPFHGEVLWVALARGPMRRRHAWALELAIRSRGACRVPTCALTRRQRGALEQVRSTAVRLPMSPFARLLIG